MSDLRAASRYAKSLLELAGEQGAIDEVQKDMQLFTRVCAENSNFVLMLKNPVIKHDKKRAILQSIFEGKVNRLTLAIFDIITRKNREKIMPAIAREFQNQFNILRKIRVAKVTTAVELDDDLRKEMKKIVEQVSGMSNVELVEEIDKDIIGGFILKMDDKQIDDSIRMKLKTMANQFSQNQYNREI